MPCDTKYAGIRRIPYSMLDGCQLNFIVMVVLHWPSAGSLGTAPSVLRMAQRHRGIIRHRPCVDSRWPIWPTRRHSVQAGAHLRPLRDSRWHRRGLLPKRALGAHHLWCCGGKLHPVEIRGRVTADSTRFAGLAGRAGAELQHDDGRDLAAAGGQRCVVDEHFVALGPHGSR